LKQSFHGAELRIDDTSVHVSGSWTAPNLQDVEKALSAADWPANSVTVDLGGLEKLDTSGAWLICRAINENKSAGKQVTVIGADERTTRFLKLIEDRSGSAVNPPKPEEAGFLEGIGRHVGAEANQYLEYLSFVGQLALESARVLLRPWLIRWALVVKELQNAGTHALPIVGLLAFLIGIVIAYQGGIVLRDYGANIYIADIVGLSTVRELAPLITSIIVAGRTGSAYTAQIGTMMVTEEIDALRSIGISPMEMLVLPKLIALVIALPLLTVFADIIGLLGGMVMATSMLGLNAITYFDRLDDALTLDSYLSGVGKAPVFAVIIATVGCFQGFRVFGSADSVGRQTTISVVQSIFLVIITDALFSIAFSKLGI